MTRVLTVSILFWVVVSTALDGATLGEVLSCGRRGEAGGLPDGTEMIRVTLDTRRYPQAVCNDATPGVFFVSPATRVEDRSKWVIFLQGGGSCTSAIACASRWCSAGTNFGMDKMTSSLSHSGIRGNGLLDRRVANDFGTWNHVLIYYCSSDTWTGDNDLALTASSESGASVTYDIHFRGSRIIDAVLDTLGNPVRRRLIRSDGSTGQVMPDLDDATDVLLAGSSAGGNGVIQNADRVGAILRSTNKLCAGGTPCPLRYKAGVDAALNPQSEDLNYSVTTMCAGNPALCTYEGIYSARYEAVNRQIWGSRLDESCIAWHAAEAPGTEWRCGDGEHLFSNHIASPLFARQDLQDQLLSGNFSEAGFGTRSDFATLVEADLRKLSNLPQLAEEGPFMAGGTAPAVFGPQCTGHEAFTNNEEFYDLRIPQDDSSWTFEDVLSNWWNGTQPQVVIRSFSGQPGAAPECP